MTREQVLEMVAKGEISPEEANGLLKKLERPRKAAWRTLLDPLSRASTPVSLAASSLFAVGGLGLSRLGIRFDGAFDLHLGAQPVPLWTALADQVVAWPVLAAVLWGAARLLAGQVRFVDFLNGVGLARGWLLVTAAALLPFADRMARLTPPAIDPSSVAVLVAIALPGTGLFFTALTLAYRTASGLRGARLAFSLVGALLVAEVVSKLLLLACV
ncbi:MAG: hypothetical protein HY901_22450 [Deltaproteobacteria bacterium]|nr:hypothetical protein [Deltaproteobacteria bacterium]